MGHALLLQEGEQRDLIASGIDGVERGEKESFQVYRRRLIEYWVDEFHRSLEDLIHNYDAPVKFTFEAMPGQGGGNFSTGGAVQTELAKTAATACQAMCHFYGVEWQTVSARTVKKVVAGNSQATKVGVRNAVLNVFPELEPRKAELTRLADESDAIAIALWASGYKGPVMKSTKRSKK
jgi:hypothetical protein